MKLQKVATHTRARPPTFLSSALDDLNDAPDTVILELEADVDRTVLPPKCKLPPNKNNDWPNQKPVISARVKGKTAAKHTDPYSSGKAPGKKAKPDAREPAKIAGPRCVGFASILSHSQKLPDTHPTRTNGHLQALNKSRLTL